jgi:hypothetical protein
MTDDADQQPGTIQQPAPVQSGEPRPRPDIEAALRANKRQTRELKRELKRRKKLDKKKSVKYR